MNQIRNWEYDAAGNQTGSTVHQRTLTTPAVRTKVETRSVAGRNQLTGLTATPGSSLIEGTVNELSNVTVNGQAAPLAFSAAAPYGFQKELNLPPGGQVITIQSTDGSANSAQKSYTLTVRGDYALAYDVNGNLFTKTWRQAGNSGVDWVKETYEWDKENRLTGWTKERLLVTGVQTAAVLASATWTYDGLGRRVKEQNVAGAAVTNTHFVWDGLTLVQWQNTTGVAQRNLFDEGEHDVITGEKLIYVRDHLGSVRGWHRLSDGARGEADYSAWGVRTVVSNTTGTLPVRSFTGHYQHAASGLVLAPYRGYDAELGRWLSEDPLDNAELIEGANLYRYVQNTPVNMIDPDGRGAVGFFIRALKGGWRAVTPGRARKAIAAGDDVLTKGCGKSGAAKKLAKDTFGDKTVRHDPRAPGQKPHYQHKNGGRGHIFYGIASGLTLEYWAKPESKDPYAAKIGCAVDFFNPLSIGKDVMDLFGAGDDE